MRSHGLGPLLRLNYTVHPSRISVDPVITGRLVRDVASERHESHEQGGAPKRAFSW